MRVTKLELGHEGRKEQDSQTDPALLFGILKATLGFRGFRLRGLAGAATEWTLITLAYNLRRLHRLGAKLQTTPAAA